MSIVSHSEKNLVTIDGEEVNGFWREDNEEIVIGMYAECDMVDFFGELIREFSDTRTKFNIVSHWIEETFKDSVVDITYGWSTKTQYWRNWKIKK